MKRVFVSFLAIVASAAIAFGPMSVAQLAKEVDKHDGKKVTVVGVVDKFEQRTSRAGNPYFTAVLLDKSDKKVDINVYSRGKAAKELKKGDIVEITGDYRKEKKLGKLTFKNEIETKPELIKILSTK